MTSALDVRSARTREEAPAPSGAPSRARRRAATRLAAESADRRRRRVSTVVVLVVVALVAAAALAIAVVRSGPTHVGLGVAVPMAGLEVTVVAYGRRVDAVAGVNSEQLPLSGPAMPMKGMSFGGAADQDGAAHDMSSMPGMAGMLEAGQERIDVSVSVSNRQDASRTLDANEFRLFSQGRQVPLLQPTVSDLPTTSLPAAFTAVGQLTFVIPEGTTPLELRYGDGSGRVGLETAPADGRADDGHGHDHDHGHGHGHGGDPHE